MSLSDAIFARLLRRSGLENAAIEELMRRISAGDLPVPGSGDVGKVPTVNAGHTGYELDVPSGGSASVPIATTGAYIDTTTYDDPVNAGQKLAVVVVPADVSALSAAVATATEGAVQPTYYMPFAGGNGIYLGDGVVDLFQAGGNIYATSAGDGIGVLLHFTTEMSGANLAVGRYNDVTEDYENVCDSPLAIGHRGDNNKTHQPHLLGGTGAPTALAGTVGDCYIRKDGGDGSWIYRCTVEGTAGNAIWVAKL